MAQSTPEQVLLADKLAQDARSTDNAVQKIAQALADAYEAGKSAAGGSRTPATDSSELLAIKRALYALPYGASIAPGAMGITTADGVTQYLRRLAEELNDVAARHDERTQQLAELTTQRTAIRDFLGL